MKNLEDKHDAVQNHHIHVPVHLKDSKECDKSLRSHHKRKREHLQLHMKHFFTAVPKTNLGEETGAPSQQGADVSLPQPENEVQDKSLRSTDSSKNAWKTIFKKIEPPMCSGHGERCVIREVKKNGNNKGRLFFVCNRADGPPPVGRCGFFKWYTDRKMQSSGL